ncbi:MAG: NnrS family protein [Wenzhouxiangellaceae bacterium]|nr:NnrS family protein [Wenzhouxiangellaceae bacterium]
MPKAAQTDQGVAGFHRRGPLVERLLFPAAAGYGAIAVPLSVHSMHGGKWAVAGLSSPLGHAHELFFGYALAVVAGFLINRLSRPMLALLGLLWLMARISWLAAPGSLLSFAANAGFAVAVAAIAAPRFMHGAKKWRKKVIGPLVIAICLVALAFQVAGFPGRAWLQYLLLQQATLLFALMMVFFGGRLIAPAAAGAIQATGGLLKARIQPRIEGALLLLLMAAVVLAVIPHAKVASGVLLMAAGLLTLVRLLRWRLWACRTRVDLICLGVGYAWLAAGLIMIGASWSLGFGPSSRIATHAITIGALGTLTATIMIRVRLIHARRYPEIVWPFPVLAALMLLAASFRFAGAVNPAMLTWAATCWSLAMVLLLGALLGFAPAGRKPAQTWTDCRQRHPGRLPGALHGNAGEVH